MVDKLTKKGTFLYNVFVLEYYMTIFLYFILAVVVVILSIKLSQYVDMLDKTTKMSGALIGGVFLAAVTSLPELFTSISAVLFLDQSELVLGNVMGSDIFNVAVLGVLLLVFMKSFSKKSMNAGLIWTSIFLLLFYGFAIYATIARWQLCLWGINTISFLFIILYFISVKCVAQETDKEQGAQVALTPKQIWIRFSLASVLLVASSIGITYLSDALSTQLGLGKTFAGAILLGIATSLPEVVSTIGLFKLGNFDAGVSNILGSNTFNFLILSIADFMNFKSPIYVNNTTSQYLLWCGLISAISILMLLFVKVYKKRHGWVSKIASSVLCAIPVAMYFVFLILPNV